MKGLSVTQRTKKEECRDTTLLLFLFRNGWGAGQSDMWMTGYIMGWLTAFYEQEDGQLALCISVAEHQEG